MTYRLRHLALLLPIACLAVLPMTASSQSYNSIDEDGNVSRMDGSGTSRNKNFNPHNNDTTSKNKVVPKGIYVWTVDRRFGDRTSAEVDTLPHLYPHTTLSTGKYGEYNTLGNNYTPRLSRIFINRPEGEEFIFNQPFDNLLKQPDEWHFTNTLSPITNLSYDNCGDKQDGEDHIEAKFAVNAGKRLGMGFDLNYAYARGYFQNQSTSHFMTTFYTSYLGDRYQMHALFSTNHQKYTESGGINNDDYITHPDLFETFSENEIPTILERNWNRLHHEHLFLTHRYSVGFYRKVPMTEAEIKARKFAEEARKQKEGEQPDKKRQSARKEGDTVAKADRSNMPKGRPADAPIAGVEPQKEKPRPLAKTDSLGTAADSLLAANDSLLAAADSLRMPADSLSQRIRVSSKAQSDSLLAEMARRDSIDATMKDEFVPVTSFIHTAELNNFERTHLAYASPKDYYANTYYNTTDGEGYAGDSIYDHTTMLQVRNTLAIALLEGFNKYAKAGLKGFVAHELRRYTLPMEVVGDMAYAGSYNEHDISIGGQLSKQQGHTWHYDLTAEAWVAGDDIGQLTIDFNTDLNFPLFGDTVRLQGSAYFHRLVPSAYYHKHHSKHLWWDNDLSMETRTRIEGTFAYDKTKTRLRVGIEELQNYTYLGMSYDYTSTSRKTLTAGVRQQASNLNVMTAQLMQDFKLGPLHWDNVLTYQSSSNSDVLPLPAFNAFSNLYLTFKIARVLTVELGGSLTYFTPYEAPDYVPALGQYAVQENKDSRVEIGNFPIVDAYANLHLKHARFFVMMSNVLDSSANKMRFLAPHYPQNGSTLHMGVSWNFFN